MMKKPTEYEKGFRDAIRMMIMCAENLKFQCDEVQKAMKSKNYTCEVDAKVKLL